MLERAKEKRVRLGDGESLEQAKGAFVQERRLVFGR